MGIQSISRAVLGRHGRGAFVVAAVVVGIAAWGRLGLQRDSGETWQVARRAQSEEDRAESRERAALGDLGIATKLEAVAAPRRTREEPRRTVEEPRFEWGAIIRVRFRPVLAEGGAPRSVHVAIDWWGFEAGRWSGRAVPDENGRVTLRVPWRGNVDHPSGIMIGTSGSVLTAVQDRRVLYGRLAGQVARCEVPSIGGSGGSEPTLDLGAIALTPPAHLGTLRFLRSRAEPFDVTLHSENDVAYPTWSSGFRPNRTRKRVDGGAAELRFATFAEPTTWSAVVPGPGGLKAFRHTGQPGEIVDVVFVEPQGLKAKVDLGRHARAARVVILSMLAPQSDASLGKADYRAREADAVRILALPMPDRRRHLSEYPLGHVELDDGSYRVELWSLRDVSGMRDRLAFRTFKVAGDRTELAL